MRRYKLSVDSQQSPRKFIPPGSRLAALFPLLTISGCVAVIVFMFMSSCVTWNIQFAVIHIQLLQGVSIYKQTDVHMF